MALELLFEFWISVLFYFVNKFLKSPGKKLTRSEKPKLLKRITILGLKKTPINFMIEKVEFWALCFWSNEMLYYTIPFLAKRHLPKMGRLQLSFPMDVEEFPNRASCEKKPELTRKFPTKIQLWSFDKWCWIFTVKKNSKSFSCQVCIFS